VCRKPKYFCHVVVEHTMNIKVGENVCVAQLSVGSFFIATNFYFVH
jgi:hypothetical protein